MDSRTGEKKSKAEINSESTKMLDKESETQGRNVFKKDQLFRSPLAIYYTGPERTFRYRQSRTPLIFQNVETDRTIRVDVWVVALCLELNFRRLERVVGRELDVDCFATFNKRRHCSIISMLTETSM